MLNLAIITTKKGAYSETFINQHIQRLPFNVFHYYGKFVPNQVDNNGRSELLHSNRLKLSYKLQNTFGNNDLSFKEYAFLLSLKKNNIQIVLAEYGPVAEKILRVIEKLHLPLVVHFHGADLSRHDVIESHVDYHRISGYASALVVVSRAMEQKALSLGFPKTKTKYNVYGPDDRFLDMQASLEDPVLLAIGRFTDKKAPYLTLMAFNKILAEYPDARLKLVGNGELMPTCLNLTRVFGIGKQVEFPGVLTPDEIMEQMSTARAFVQHSVTAEDGDMEGTPLTVLESQAAGLPVISTRHAGIPDIVIHEETGYLVDELDINGMAAYMLEVLRDKQKAKTMGKAAKDRIAANYSLKRHIDELAEIITEAYENRK